MATSNLQRSPAAEQTASCATILDTLKHLHSVTVGESFYFNSVKISDSSLRKCCENYWHQSLPDRLSDEQLDLTRLQLLIRFTDLVNEFEERPADRNILFNLREQLQSIFPRNSDARISYHRQKPTSHIGTCLLDLKIVTVAFIDTLIKFCQILQQYDDSNAFCYSVVCSIQDQFVRPYLLILWARAKKELRV
ncbi:uncharacterized protein TDEL_0F04120 [Torulaspora delbrueckii]|uniref:Uncharacterized protein n=1 Tax=Torulaspora delbrueckii TaxID=4950 RepID=G8ZX79_TORDE|nr:hypothetical protein TDEL_0F04120 [Torulaspora delbrueckii]CCE93223.1 hypothetical protein TDEL_0F04120 [Torulaspora delbrueckii]